MATYTGFGATSGGTASPADNSGYVMGLAFAATQAGMQFDGWRLWAAPSQTGAAEDYALWTVTGVATGTYVTGSKVTSGTLVPGWNFIPAATPIPLTAGQEYLAVRSVNRYTVTSFNYSAVAHYFDSGGAGRNGVVSGPLNIFSAGAADGGTDPDSFGRSQQVFVAGVTDVVTNFPASSFNDTWYGMDVQITDIASSGASLVASGSLVTGGLVAKLAAAGLAASPGLTAGPVVTGLAQVSLGAACSLTASPFLTRSGSAVLGADAALTAAPSGQVAQATLDDLWGAYLAAHQAASDASLRWRMMRGAGGTDGSAGFLYQDAYETEQAAHRAYDAWRAAQAAAFPGARG